MITIKIGALEHNIELGSIASLQSREETLKELTHYTELMLKSYLELKMARVAFTSWKENTKFEIKKDLISIGEDFLEETITSKLLRGDSWLKESEKVLRIEYSYKVLKEVVKVINQVIA